MDIPGIPGGEGNLSLSFPGIAGPNSQAFAAQRADEAVNAAAQALLSVRAATDERIEQYANEAREVLSELRSYVLGSIDRRIDGIVPIIDNIRQRILSHLDNTIEQAGAYLTGLYYEPSAETEPLTGEALIEHVLNAAGVNTGQRQPGGNVINPTIDPSDPDYESPTSYPIIAPVPPSIPPTDPPADPPTGCVPSVGWADFSLSGQGSVYGIDGSPVWSTAKLIPTKTPDGSPFTPVVVTDPELAKALGVPVGYKIRTIPDGCEGGIWSDKTKGGPCEHYITMSIQGDECGGDDTSTGNPPSPGNNGHCELDCPPGSHPVNPLDEWGDPVEPDEPLCGVNDPANWQLGENEFTYCGPPPETPEGCLDSGEPIDGGDGGDDTITTEPPVDPTEPPTSGPPIEFRRGTARRDTINDPDNPDPTEPPTLPPEPIDDIPPWAQPINAVCENPPPDTPSIPVPPPQTVIDGCDPSKWREAQSFNPAAPEENFDQRARLIFTNAFSQLKSNIDGLDLGWLPRGLLMFVAGAFSALLTSTTLAIRLISNIFPKPCPPNSCADTFFLARNLMRSSEKYINLFDQSQVNAIEYSANFCCQTNVLSTAAATACRLNGTMDENEWKFAAKLNGDCIPWFERQYKAQLPAISFAQANGFLAAGLMSIQDYTKAIARHGFEANADTRYFDMATEKLPGAETIVNWINDGIFDDGMAAEFGLDDGFDEGFQGEAKEWLLRQNVPEAVARKMYRAQNRTDVSVSDIRAGFINGVIKEGELGNWLNRFGIGPKDTTTLIDIWRRSTVNARATAQGKLSQRQLLRLASNDGITLDVYEQELVNLGFAPDEAATSKQSAKLFKEAKDRTQLLPKLRAAFLHGRIDEDQYYQDLVSAGVDYERTQVIIERDKMFKSVSEKSIPAAQLCKLYDDGLITLSDYFERLKNLGYTETDIMLMTGKCNKDIIDREQEKRRKEELAAIKLLEQQAKQAAALARKANSDARTRHFRHSPYRPRPKPIAPLDVTFPDGFGGQGNS